MTCTECKSSWFTSWEIAKNLTECPFCHSPLYEEKAEQKPVFNNINTDISEAIAYIAYEYGKNLVWDNKKLNAYLSDIAPSLVKERRRIKLAFSIGAVEILKNAADKSDEERKLCIMQAVSCLMNEADVSETAARATVSYFTDALKWKVALKSKPEMWADKAYEAYRNGDYKTAVKFAKLSANYENAAAQNLLGDCFYWGHGVGVDEFKAAEWYKRAADNGDSNAMCSLGDCYASGVGVQQNIERARKYYRQSADMGNKRALLEL